MTTLIKATKDSGALKDYIKYDAMITACALRHRADCLITLDEKSPSVTARIVGLDVKAPADFQQPEQRQLSLLAPPKKSSE